MLPARDHAATIAVATLATGWIFREKLELIAKVTKYSFMVYVIDMLPAQTRRSILAQEYSGEMLEKRLTQRIFKGLSTVRALWRMTSINHRPRIAVGDAVPYTPVISLQDGKELALGALARGERPLVLNFGSCT